MGASGFSSFLDIGAVGSRVDNEEGGRINNKYSGGNSYVRQREGGTSRDLGIPGGLALTALGDPMATTASLALPQGQTNTGEVDACSAVLLLESTVS